MRGRAEALATTAEQLRELVGRFRLRGETRDEDVEAPEKATGRLAA